MSNEHKLTADQRKRIKLEYLSGSSISEVAHKIKMSPSGVVYHLRQSNVKMRKRGEAVLLKHHKRLNSYGVSIPKRIPSNLKDLYLVGLALYWGEGAKTGNTVAITNSDPEIILTFLSFLKKICKVDEKRLRALIHYHADQSESDLVSYWSALTKIKEVQFYKSTLHRASTKKSTNHLKFGTISLRYSDTLLLKEVLARIAGLKYIHKPE